MIHNLIFKNSSLLKNWQVKNDNFHSSAASTFLIEISAKLFSPNDRNDSKHFLASSNRPKPKSAFPLWIIGFTNFGSNSSAKMSFQINADWSVSVILDFKLKFSTPIWKHSWITIRNSFFILFHFVSTHCTIRPKLFQPGKHFYSFGIKSFSLFKFLLFESIVSHLLQSIRTSLIRKWPRYLVCRQNSWNFAWINWFLTFFKFSDW